jgi:hypothetical protein
MIASANAGSSTPETSAGRQLTVMLGFALGRNAIAADLHRRRQAPKRAA